MKFLKNSLFIAFALLLVNCQTNAPSPSTPPTSGTSKTSTGPEVAHPPQEPVQLPGFVAQRTPRVGLIFGPGGAKTFAHIGVLQELERYKMPIVAVAGLEWGALVGSLYSLNSQSHEVDWKMSQLPKQTYSTKNLFSNKMKPVSTASYAPYLEKVFQNSKVEDTKIPFACPYIKGASGKTAIVKSGVAKSSLKACWFYPPLFDVKEVMAAPFALAEVTEFLRKEGAELIIYIDVLGSADKKDFADWSEDQMGWFSWVAVQNSISSAKYFGIQETIKVDTSTYSMQDTDQRLRLIQVGKQASASAIDRIAKKYDF